jgi:uncharacterized repeat protein (TIGR01451 family)
MIKQKTHVTLRGLLLAGAAAAALSQSVFAAGTLQGTVISNTASVDYKVATVSQPTVNSSAVTFKVDRKVIFAVATSESAAVSVTPGTSGNVLKFTVTNTSNDTLDFDLAAVALSGTAAKFGGTDNVDASSAPSVFVDSNANSTYEAGSDTATSIDNLAPGAAITVFVVATFNTSFATGDIASYHLKATAKDSSGGALSDDSGSADVAGTVQNVFADAAGSAPGDVAKDKVHSDYADYKIVTATLTVSKSSAVISDPINGGTNPKAIPGAVIEYTITVSNGAGAASATNVVVTDSLATEVGNGTIAFKTDGYAAGKGIQVTAPNLYSGAPTSLTNAGSDDEGDFNITAANTVTVTGISLNASQSATVKFQVTIQ